jgi:hypothetical protein
MEETNKISALPNKGIRAKLMDPKIMEVARTVTSLTRRKTLPIMARTRNAAVAFAASTAPIRVAERPIAVP